VDLIAAEVGREDKKLRLQIEDLEAKRDDDATRISNLEATVAVLTAAVRGSIDAAHAATEAEADAA
jgi:hypothetical protein